MSLEHFVEHPLTTPVVAGWTVPEIAIGAGVVYLGWQALKGAARGIADGTRSYVGGLLGAR